MTKDERELLLLLANWCVTLESVAIPTEEAKRTHPGLKRLRVLIEAVEREDAAIAFSDKGFA
jgi:hypothetical protein